jgi:uncharacterized Ntn-hydrolase superfamily protein
VTYSIIARDPSTGQMGVAVQTCNLAVGTWVTWAEGGVGAVATQALADRTYGTLGLDLMRGGKPADEALTALLAADSKSEFRQVSMLDTDGRIASHTGRCCLPAAGSYQGETFSTQANMVAREAVWMGMAEAYERASGDLADRLMAALDAGQANGGDIRGRQTTAMLIVDGKRNAIPIVDLRVDHHPDPVGELHRLLRLHRAYMMEYQIMDYVEAGELEPVDDLLQQIEEMAAEEPYLQCLRALHLERDLGRREEALDILGVLVGKLPAWREYLEREVQADKTSPCPGLDQSFLTALDARMKTKTWEADGGGQ